MTATQQRFAMQQPVQTSESTAPRLGQAAPWQPVIRTAGQPAGKDGRAEAPRRRTPLAIVPAPMRKSGRGFVALCISVLAAALMTVLVTNITVSNRQYDLVSLKNEQLDLSQSNELLRQQVEHLEAPQNLAAEATKLGMVNPGDVASIDLPTGSVIGTATAAEAEDKPSGLVAAPTSPAERQAAGTDVAAEEAEQPETAAPDAELSRGAGESAEPAGNDDAGSNDANGADDTADQADKKDEAAQTNQADTTDEAAEDKDLNGGTIPAPQFSARGN